MSPRPPSSLKRFISGTTADFEQFRRELRDRLPFAQSQENLPVGTGTNLEKLAEFLNECNEVVHLVGPALGGGWTKAAEVNKFLRDWRERIPLETDPVARQLWTQLESDPRFATWPRTYWEAYLAILLGKPLFVFWQIPDEGDSRHATEEGRLHYQIISGSGLERSLLKKNKYTVDHLVSLIQERPPRRPTSYPALALSQAVYPYYISRPKYEAPVCEWLSAIINNVQTPAPSKLLTVWGESNIGKTQLVAWCLKHCNVKVGEKTGDVRALYFKSGPDDGLTFRNLIHGGAEYLLSAEQRAQLADLWPWETDPPKDYKEKLVRQWLAGIREQKIRAIFWIDQAEHSISGQTKLHNPELATWVTEWDATENSVYVLATTRKLAHLVRPEHRTDWEIKDGLPESPETLQYLRARGLSADQFPDAYLTKLIRTVKGSPGRLDEWVRFFTGSRRRVNLSSNIDPNEEAIGFLSDHERKTLMTVNILNQTAASIEEIATVMQREVADVAHDFDGLELWLDPVVTGRLRRYTMHDGVKETLEKIYHSQPDEKRKLTELCAKWLTAQPGRAPAEWNKPEDVVPWIRATDLYIRAAMFSDAGQLLEEIDNQVPPRISMLFRFRMAIECKRLRTLLRGKLAPQSEFEWLNWFQLGLAELRLGNNPAAAVAALREALAIAEKRWPVRACATLHYLALAELYQNGSFDGQALLRASALVTEAKSKIVGIRHRDRTTLGVRGNVTGLSGTISLNRSLLVGLKEKVRLTQIAEAVQELRRARDLTKSAQDRRANPWWRLLHAKARCIQAMLKSSPAPPVDLKTITTIADATVDAREPETHSDALLFCSDYCRALGQDAASIRYAQNGLTLARQVANSKSLVRFGLRLLLLAPDDSLGRQIRDGFLRLNCSLEELLMPLRSAATRDRLFAIPAEQIDQLRRILQPPRSPEEPVASQSGYKD